eukprot:Nitzschia sp. Nitz4//scaffold19_size178191//118681//120983//NITZ4_001993-RA/size178191-augustus-gene-0.152-mRNA-1//-1//CDS//3329540729//7534//frame0
MNFLLRVILLLGIWEGNSQGISFRELTEECQRYTEAKVESLQWFDSVVNILSECGGDKYLGENIICHFCETDLGSSNCQYILESQELLRHCPDLVQLLAGCCSGFEARTAEIGRMGTKASKEMEIKTPPKSLSNRMVPGLRGQMNSGDRRVSDATNSAATIPDKHGLETHMIIVISIVGGVCGMLMYWFVFHEPLTRRKRRRPRPPTNPEKEKSPLIESSAPSPPNREDAELSSTVSNVKSNLDNQDETCSCDKPPVLRDASSYSIKRAGSWTSNVRSNKVSPAPIQQAHARQIDAAGMVTPVCAHQIDATGMITPIARKASRGPGGMGDTSDSSKSSDDSSDELEAYERRHESRKPPVHVGKGVGAESHGSVGQAVIRSTSSVDDFSDKPGTKQRRDENSQQRINFTSGERKEPSDPVSLELPMVSSKGSVDDFSDEPGTKQRRDENSQRINFTSGERKESSDPVSLELPMVSSKGSVDDFSDEPGTKQRRDENSQQQRINIESDLGKDASGPTRLELPAVSSKSSVDDFSDEPGTKQRRDEGQQRMCSETNNQEEEQDRDSSLSPDDDNDLLDNHGDSNHDFTYALPQEYRNCLSPLTPSDDRDAYYGGVYYGEDEPDQGYMLQSRIASPQTEERSEASLYGGVNYGSDDDTDNPPMEYVSRYDGDDAISQPTYDGFDEWATNSIDSRLSINSRDTILSSEWQRRLRDDQLEPVSERVDQLHPVSEEEAVHNSYTTDSSYLH